MDQGRGEGGRLPALRRRARARARRGRGGDDGDLRRHTPCARQGGLSRRGVACASLSRQAQRRLERLYRRPEGPVVAFGERLGGHPREEQALLRWARARGDRGAGRHGSGGRALARTGQALLDADRRAGGLEIRLAGDTFYLSWRSARSARKERALCGRTPKRSDRIAELELQPAVGVTALPATGES